MRAYLAYDEGGTEEIGDADGSRIPSLIERAEESLNAERPFSIGFYRSEKDFLEIRPVGRSQFMIWSDVIASAGRLGLLARFLGTNAHIDKIVTGRDAAAAVVNDYMTHPREAFERKYG